MEKKKKNFRVLSLTVGRSRASIDTENETGSFSRLVPNRERIMQQQQQQFDAAKVSSLAQLLKEEQSLLYRQGQLVVDLVSSTEEEEDQGKPLAKRIEALVEALIGAGVHDDRKTLTARLLRARQIFLAGQTLQLGDKIAQLPVTGQKALATLATAVEKGAVKPTRAQQFAAKLTTKQKDGNGMYEEVQHFLGKTPKTKKGKNDKEPTTDANTANTANTETEPSLPRAIIDALGAASAAADAGDAGFILGKDARVPRAFVVAIVEGFLRRNPKKMADIFESLVEEVKHRIS